MFVIFYHQTKDFAAGKRIHGHRNLYICKSYYITRCITVLDSICENRTLFVNLFLKNFVH